MPSITISLASSSRDRRLPVRAPANAPPERIRPAAEAGSDPLVWDLTNTHGSRFRTVFMRAPNTPFGLELSEFFDVPRGERPANPWDPGAATLVFTVRDLDALVPKLKARGAPVVTLGGGAIDSPAGRAILVRDPDGGLVEVRQGTPAAVSAANSARRRHRDLDRHLGGPAAARARVLPRPVGALSRHDALRRPPANFVCTAWRLAGSRRRWCRFPARPPRRVVLSEFSLPAGSAHLATPFAWRLQDVGSPQFQLQVAGLDALMARTTQAGYRFLSVGGKPIQRPFGRFVFAIDPDGVLVEFVEPAIRTPIR